MQHSFKIAIIIIIIIFCCLLEKCCVSSTSTPAAAAAAAVAVVPTFPSFCFRRCRRRFATTFALTPTKTTTTIATTVTFRSSLPSSLSSTPLSSSICHNRYQLLNNKLINRSLKKMKSTMEDNINSNINSNTRNEDDDDNDVDGINDDDNSKKNKNKNKNKNDTTSNPLSELGLPEPLILGSASFTRKLILKEMGIPYKKFVRPIDEKALGDRSSSEGGVNTGTLPKELVTLIANAKMDRLVQEVKLMATSSSSNKINNDASSSLSEFEQQKLVAEEFVILTGDQVVTCDGKIFEKPVSVMEAKEFVTKYATNPPSTVGSCVLYHHPTGVRVSGVDTATIYFNFTTSTTEVSLLNDNGSVSGCGGTSISLDSCQAATAAKLIDDLLSLGEPVLSCAGGLMIEHPLVQNHVDRIDGTVDSVMGLSKDLVLRLLQELQSKIKNKIKK